MFAHPLILMIRSHYGIVCGRMENWRRSLFRSYLRSVDGKWSAFNPSFLCIFLSSPLEYGKTVSHGVVLYKGLCAKRKVAFQSKKVGVKNKIRKHFHSSPCENMSKFFTCGWVSITQFNGQFSNWCERHMANN